MTVTVVGDYPSLIRLRTGLARLDRAVGDPQRAEWGWPLQTVAEMYGPPGVGKTTLGLWLSGLIDASKTILVVPLERADKEYMVSNLTGAGFHGTVELVPFKDKKGKLMNHSQIITDAVNRLGSDEKVSSLIIDSLAAVVPSARNDGLIGEAYMGDRARFLKDLTARAEGKLVNRDTPAVMIGINHQTTSLDPRNRGHITPGGTGFKFHSAVRISLWRKEVFPKPGDTDESRIMKGQVAEGTVEKLRFGGPGRKFSVYIVPGRGVHLGMSAMFDCIHYKIGTRTDQGMIRLGTETFGRIGKLVDSAFEENDKVFDPFIEALGAWEIEHMEETTNGESSDGSEEEGSGSSDELAEELEV